MPEALYTETCGEKCADSCEAVVERYGDMVYRLAVSLCKNRPDAEDVFQEVFLRYLRSQGKMQSEEHRKAWLLRVTVNCSKSHFSSLKRRQALPLDESLPAPEPGGGREVYEAVRALPVKYRTAVHLFYYEGYSVREIAGICGARESTVKTWLYRARLLLKDSLEEDA